MRLDPVIINIVIIILELAGLYISISHGGWRILAFYTQLSNIVTLISSAVFTVNSGAAFTAALRYLSTVMLTMTVLITIFVLIPSGVDFAKMMLRGSGLFHHTLCPAISIPSYILLEKHSSLWILPVAVTFIYGLVMLCLNYRKICDGPYPFFRIHNQSMKTTVIWMIALTLLITLLSVGIVWIAD